jgi:hypothetical protein
MNRQTNDVIRAFLQGLTGAGLFRRLSYPGAPTEFVDSRSLRDIHAYDEEFSAISYHHELRGSRHFYNPQTEEQENDDDPTEPTPATKTR